MAGTVTYTGELIPQMSGPTLTHGMAAVSGTGVTNFDGTNVVPVVLLDANSPSSKITPAQAVAQGSTTSGQQGNLAQGAVTTAAPTYTTAQTSPLSLTTAGALRGDLASVNGVTVPVGVGAVSNAPRVAAAIMDGFNAAQVNAGATQKALYTTPTDGTTAIAVIAGNNALKVDISSVNGTNTTGALALDTSVTGLQVTQGSTTSGQKGGLDMGAVTTSAPAYTTAQTSPLSLTTAGGLRMDLASINGTTIPQGVGAVANAQRVAAAIHDGINNANMLKSDGTSGGLNAMLVAPSYQIIDNGVTISASTAGTAHDLGGYRWVSVQFTNMGTSGSVTFQCSNDNATWVACALNSSSNQSTGASQTASATGLWHGPVPGRYFRLNNTNTGGTTTVTTVASTMPSGMQALGVAAGQSGTWTVQPGNTANTTAWLTQNTPATSGGLTPSSQTALTNSVVSVKGSAGQLYGWSIENPNASVEYVQVFDATAPTLGITAPTYVIGVPASGVAWVMSDTGIAHANAIKVAATTTATGSTAPGTALVASFFYK